MNRKDVRNILANENLDDAERVDQLFALHLGNGTTLIDLTSDTITVDKILSGYTAHDMSGAPVTGTCTFDSDTSADTATVSEILATKTAHAKATSIDSI